jgi:nitrogen fixation/metabolism regulation signal transduction histidine kinase
VLHNLMQNALDATESAGRAGSRWRRGRAPDGDVARSGRAAERAGHAASAFPSNILKRAFEPYVTTKAKGTGLGLAVVKKIADEHGARIDLGEPPGRTAAVAGGASVVIIRTFAITGAQMPPRSTPL